MRQRTCNCGECKKCKQRAYAMAYYWKHKDRVLARQKERRKSGELAKYERERYHSDPEFNKRKKARNMVSIRIAKGTLERGRCEVCGVDNAHAHHDNYDNPLDIRWLCTEHHRMEHGRVREAA